MKPAAFVWRGDHMVPLPRTLHICLDQFEEEEIYLLEVREERSEESHNHYFACIHTAWKNLPEDVAEKYPTPEKLRKQALIKTGYATETTFVCTSDDEATRLAAFLKPIDEYAIVITKGNVIHRYVAESQSVKSMGKDRFQQSKEKVLRAVSNLIGVDVTTLQANARSEK